MHMLCVSLIFFICSSVDTIACAIQTLRGISGKEKMSYILDYVHIYITCNPNNMYMEAAVIETLCVSPCSWVLGGVVSILDGPPYFSIFQMTSC